ncbi:MAG: type I 3-dehydroquinate dehydratase [Fibromonadales bacterium]|nr:type I 3-dehydroquinate dehydratase [Fibromonadales bacterium]
MSSRASREKNMPKGFATKKNIVYFIAGLISPEVLRNALANSAGAEAAAIKKCGILEIRYDLFKDIAEWNKVSQKVSKLNPKALRLGTIRLEKDGGAFKDSRAAERMALFAGKDLDWIDIERGEDFSLAKKIGKKIICSWHLFNRIPSEQELSDFAEECLELKTQGCKVAAMAHSKNDIQPLYDFAKKYGKKFELFSAFAMGEHGKESRIRSLKEGANLTYASIGPALAPGQMKIEDLI